MPKQVVPFDAARIIIYFVKLLMSSKTTSAQIIAYINKYNINIDISLPIGDDMELPLIYLCCANENFIGLFNYLITHKVNVNCEPENKIELLYYAQIIYIDPLVKAGAILKPYNIDQSLRKFCIYGNVKKVLALYKSGAISKEHLIPILNSDCIFQILDRLYERVFQLCVDYHTDNEKLKQITNDLFIEYINTFKFFFKNSCNINQKSPIELNEPFVQCVLKTFFIPLIEYIITVPIDWHCITFLHYSNYSQQNRYVMKYFYNEKNYDTIKQMIANKMPQKCYIKKKKTKKQAI